MKILHIDETFHPSFGYQINSLAKFQSMKENQVYIITCQHNVIHPAFISFSSDNDNILLYDKEYENKNNVKVIRIPVRRFISGRAIYKNGYNKYIDEIKPDVILIHQVESYIAIRCLLSSNIYKYPIVFDSHMLKMGSVNKLSSIYNFMYKLIVTPKIIKSKLKVIRTQNDDYVERYFGIPLSQAPFISFGSDTQLFTPNKQVKTCFRNEYVISENDFVIVYTGKLDSAKGGKLLAETFLKKLTNINNINVVVIIVGNIPDNEYGNEVLELLNKSENRIIRFPTQKYIDLPKFYQSADLSVFAKQCSLSFYDAQACGLPVVSEDNSINVDRLKYNNGFNFKSGEPDDFRRQIIRCIEMPKDKFDKMHKNAFEFIDNNYNYEDIAKKYTDLLIDEYNKFHKGKGIYR